MVFFYFSRTGLKRFHKSKSYSIVNILYRCTVCHSIAVKPPNSQNEVVRLSADSIKTKGLVIQEIIFRKERTLYLLLISVQVS